jgi:hypothetical protein
MITQIKVENKIKILKEYYSIGSLLFSRFFYFVSYEVLVISNI